MATGLKTSWEEPVEVCAVGGGLSTGAKNWDTAYPLGNVQTTHGAKIPTDAAPS